MLTLLGKDRDLGHSLTQPLPLTHAQVGELAGGFFHLSLDRNCSFLLLSTLTPPTEG